MRDVLIGISFLYMDNGNTSWLTHAAIIIAMLSLWSYRNPEPLLSI